MKEIAKGLKKDMLSISIGEISGLTELNEEKKSVALESQIINLVNQAQLTTGDVRKILKRVLVRSYSQSYDKCFGL